jgi:hypothetical protein
MSTTQVKFGLDQNSLLPFNQDRKTLFQEKINYPSLKPNPRNTPRRLEPLPAKEEKPKVSPWKQEQNDNNQPSKDRLTLRSTRK